MRSIINLTVSSLIAVLVLSSCSSTGGRSVATDDNQVNTQTEQRPGKRLINETNY